MLRRVTTQASSVVQAVPRRHLSVTSPRVRRGIYAGTLCVARDRVVCAAAVRPRRRLVVLSLRSDPPSVGHWDIITRARRVCDDLVVAVAVNPKKQTIFTSEERVDLLRALIESPAPAGASTAPLGTATVENFHGLMVDFARLKDATVLIRGLRGTSDFEYEFRMAQINRELTGIETLFLMADVRHSLVSSTMIRELAHFQAGLTGMVPEPIAAKVYERMRVPYPITLPRAHPTAS